MPKDRAVNPATAQLKADKARALKKSKANVAQQRQERYASRNPERLQKQIDELQTLKESQGGKLKPRDQNQLDSLEKDVKLIRKAREARGVDDNRHDRSRDGAPPQKRARTDGERPARRERERDSDEESTDEEARNVPMPRDTPPPIPPRHRRTRQQQETAADEPPAKKKEVVKVFEGAPQVRNLRKEATSAFVPSAVAARLKQKQAMSGSSDKKPDGRLLEPEEVDALEKGGYADADARAKARAALHDKDKLDDDEATLLRELEEQESRHQLMEGAVRDGAHAAAEAEDEEMFARQAGEDELPVGSALADSVMADATMAASEAAKEEMIGEGIVQVQQPQPSKRRLVEIEDGSDDEW